MIDYPMKRKELWVCVREPCKCKVAVCDAEQDKLPSNPCEVHHHMAIRTSSDALHVSSK